MRSATDVDIERRVALAFRDMTSTSLIRRTLAVFGLAFVAGFVFASPAHAQTPLSVGGDAEFVIASPVWTIMTGLVLPLVIALVTKASADPKLKGIVGITLAALGAIVVRVTCPAAEVGATWVSWSSGSGLSSAAPRLTGREVR